VAAAERRGRRRSPRRARRIAWQGREHGKDEFIIWWNEDEDNVPKPDELGNLKRSDLGDLLEDDGLSAFDGPCLLFLSVY